VGPVWLREYSFLERDLCCIEEAKATCLFAVRTVSKREKFMY